jgi:hypothetical protein
VVVMGSAESDDQKGDEQQNKKEQPETHLFHLWPDGVQHILPHPRAVYFLLLYYRIRINWFN